MRLGEAILLGYPEIIHRNNVWLIPGFDGVWAVGLRNLTSDVYALKLQETGTIEVVLAKFWPWTSTAVNFTRNVTLKFHKVLNGDMTIEELADWVNSIEDAQKTPANVPGEVQPVHVAIKQKK